jgi:hypothetical protein
VCYGRLITCLKEICDVKKFSCKTETALPCPKSGLAAGSALLCPNDRIKVLPKINGRGFMKGMFYRMGIALKEAGEIAGHDHHWYAGILIRTGLAIKDFASLFPVQGKK